MKKTLVIFICMLTLANFCYAEGLTEIKKEEVKYYKLGQKNRYTKMLNEFLEANGFSASEDTMVRVTGKQIFDQETSESLKIFQNSQGILETGTMDDATVDEINFYNNEFPIEDQNVPTIPKIQDSKIPKLNTDTKTPNTLQDLLTPISPSNDEKEAKPVRKVHIFDNLLKYVQRNNTGSVSDIIGNFFNKIIYAK